jgi:sugar/nucleoside kinase (ribokinase family)
VEVQQGEFKGKQREIMTQTESASIEIITLGEVLVEIMRPAVGQPLDQIGTFKGPYPSGAPAIFAVAAARLGLNAGFIGAVGADAFGRLMRSCFEHEKVDASQLQTPSGHSTGAAFVAYEPDGEREFVFHIRHAAAGQLSAQQIQESYFEDVKWLHISGSTIFLNANSRAACLRALELTMARGGRISLDPNLRLELMPIEQARTMLEPFQAAADLVLPTAGEAVAITGEDDVDRAVEALGVKEGALVVIKKGPTGCTIYNKDERIDVPGYTVEEIDPTGAGDCFSAAFIAGLESGWPLEKIGHFANAAGALAVTQMGPMEGAPTRNQVDDLIRKTYS